MSDVSKNHYKFYVNTIAVAQTHIILQKKYLVGQWEQFTCEAAFLKLGSAMGSWDDPRDLSPGYPQNSWLTSHAWGDDSAPKWRNRV